MKDEKDLKTNKGSTTNKVRKLQKQYNKILIDLFDQFAAESIEQALEKSEGSFGENIQEIVQCALDCLKGKVLEELGVKDGAVEIGIEMGGIEDGLPEFMAGQAEEMGETEEEKDEETPEHEAEESEEFEAGEQAAGDEDEDKDEEKDEKIEEKAPPGKKMERMVKHIKKAEKKAGKGAKEAKKIAYATAWKKYNESTFENDKELSSSRRTDQELLSEAYTSMYKK